MNILGIETSCDETAAAVVKDGYELLSNTVVSQIDLHKAFGGVVPEVAARSHIEVMLPVIDEALRKAFPVTVDPWSAIDAITVTKGPGLSGSLLIGVLTARTLALVKSKPLFGVNHVLGHVYANFITEIPENTEDDSTSYPNDTSIKWIEPQFPMLALIVSGGHSQLVLFENHDNYRLLGQTQDDAVGEAFDKVAKMLGLEYPGGPSIQRAAEAGGNPKKYDFPDASLKNPYDFSFSGLKTAVLRRVQQVCGKDYAFPSFELAELLSESQVRDFAASFQNTAVGTLVSKTVKAYQQHSPASVVIAGGVAANSELRRQLKSNLPIEIDYRPIYLCTDNAAMIASLGYFHQLSHPADDPHRLEINTSLTM
jgi:N6-L-threonylcarbamoyladenine synthase